MISTFGEAVRADLSVFAPCGGEAKQASSLCATIRTGPRILSSGASSAFAGFRFAGTVTLNVSTTPSTGRLAPSQAAEIVPRLVPTSHSGCFARALKERADPEPPRLPGRAGPEVGAGTGVRLISRPIEQANLVLGCVGLARTDERRFSLGVLDAARGGGMSSRLCQGVREERGLAYSG